MILTTVRFYRGGVSYGYLTNVPLTRAIAISETAIEIGEEEKRAMEKK